MPIGSKAKYVVCYDDLEGKFHMHPTDWRKGALEVAMAYLNDPRFRNVCINMRTFFGGYRCIWTDGTWI